MFVLYDENMNEIEMPKGVTPLDIYISSIEKERVTSKLEGKDGSVDYGSTFRSRDVKLDLLLESADTQDYRLLRDSLYATFQKGDTFYVSESYQKGKRYLVSVDQSFIPERVPRNQRYADASIDCVKIGIPFAESIGTTQDIEKNGINSEDALWGFGMGLARADESLIYTFDAKEKEDFFVYNAGNVPIHPFEQDFKITIRNVKNSDGGLLLYNISTSTYFRTHETLSEDDVIVIDGASITKNGDQYLRETSRTFMELKTGYNTIRLEDCDSARIEFDFRYYYL